VGGCAHAATGPVPSAAVTPVEEQTLAALRAELRRNAAKLSLPNAPPIHLLRYHVTRLSALSAESTFGALRNWRDASGRDLGMEVRVGDPSFDSSGFGGWETGTRLHPLPELPGVNADVAVAWLETDRAYKNAVEQYGRKKASYTAPKDHPGDWQVLPPSRADEGAAPAPDVDLLTDRVRAVSAAFKAFPRLEAGVAELGAEAGFHHILGLDGTDIRRRRQEVSIAATATARAEDGMLLADRCMWTVRTVDQLPSVERMQAQAAAMAKDVLQASRAQMAEDEYVGPVVFRGTASADLFRHLLIPQLEGTPPVVPFDTVIGEMGQGLLPDATGHARQGRRVLPMGWRVVDDPQLDLGHPASFNWDAEGTPAQKVELVTDGIVRTLLMGRIPRKGVAGSNGHARGRPGERLHGRATMTTVTGPDLEARSSEDLIKKGLELAKSYGKDHVLVIDRLVDPSIIPGEVSTGDEGSGLGLPPPVVATRVYADGRTEVLRGLGFAGVHRWVLRDIAAAGPVVDLSYMAPFRPGSTTFTPIHGMPTWISVPEVVVGEMELVPRSADPRERPVVPPPKP
jgi:hypothetical protein